MGGVDKKGVLNRKKVDTERPDNMKGSSNKGVGKEEVKVKKHIPKVGEVVKIGGARKGSSDKNKVVKGGGSKKGTSLKATKKMRTKESVQNNEDTTDDFGENTVTGEDSSKDDTSATYPIENEETTKDAKTSTIKRKKAAGRPKAKVLKYRCPHDTCEGISFSDKEKFDQHMVKFHDADKISCYYECGTTFTSHGMRRRHQRDFCSVIKSNTVVDSQKVFLKTPLNAPAVHLDYYEVYQVASKLIFPKRAIMLQQALLHTNACRAVVLDILGEMMEFPERGEDIFIREIIRTEDMPKTETADLVEISDDDDDVENVGFAENLENEINEEKKGEEDGIILPEPTGNKRARSPSNEASSHSLSLDQQVYEIPNASVVNAATDTNRLQNQKPPSKKPKKGCTKTLDSNSTALVEDNVKTSLPTSVPGIIIPLQTRVEYEHPKKLPIEQGTSVTEKGKGTTSKFDQRIESELSMEVAEVDYGDDMSTNYNKVNPHDQPIASDDDSSIFIPVINYGMGGIVSFIKTTSQAAFGTQNVATEHILSRSRSQEQSKEESSSKKCTEAIEKNCSEKNGGEENSDGNQEKSDSKDNGRKADSQDVEGKTRSEIEEKGSQSTETGVQSSAGKSNIIDVPKDNQNIGLTPENVIASIPQVNDSAQEEHLEQDQDSEPEEEHISSQKPSVMNRKVPASPKRNMLVSSASSAKGDQNKKKTPRNTRRSKKTNSPSTKKQTPTAPEGTGLNESSSPDSNYNRELRSKSATRRVDSAQKSDKVGNPKSPDIAHFTAAETSSSNRPYRHPRRAQRDLTAYQMSG